MSVAKVARMSEGEAYETFKSIRWSANDSNPICHHCERQFSVTLVTIFANLANRKLPMTDYLLAIALFVNAHKGLSTLQLSRGFGIQYKTAFVLSHKIRNSLGKMC